MSEKKGKSYRGRGQIDKKRWEADRLLIPEAIVNTNLAELGQKKERNNNTRKVSEGLKETINNEIVKEEEGIGVGTTSAQAEKLIQEQEKKQKAGRIDVKIGDNFYSRELGLIDNLYSKMGRVLTLENYTAPAGLHGLFLAYKRMDKGVIDYNVSSGYIFDNINFEIDKIPDNFLLKDDLKQIINKEISPHKKFAEFMRYMQEVSEKEFFPTPQWIQQANKPGYQIMIDRFYNPALESNEPAVKEAAWKKWRELQGRQEIDYDDNFIHAGGTLQGVIDKLDYIKESASFIYINPIYEADSIHKYNAFNYLTVDHRYAGFSEEEYNSADNLKREQMKSVGLSKFAELTEQIPVVLDIAFNHSGKDFFAFKDILKNGQNSLYSDWYKGLVFNDNGMLKDWDGWWGFKDLPEFDHHSKGLQKHLLGEFEQEKSFKEQNKEWQNWVELLKNPKTRADVISDINNLKAAQKSLGVAGFWSAIGIKGWRLDVPNNVNRWDFWPEFRSLVKTIDPEIWLVGESWDNEDDTMWLWGDKFDATMNYRFLQWTLDFLVGPYGKRMEHMYGERASHTDAGQFAERMKWFVSRHPDQVIRSMMNPAGNHDIPRFNDVLNNNPALIEMGYLILGTLPGALSNWAGDEVGMNSGDLTSRDPMNRKPFDWKFSNETPSLKSFKKLVNLKIEHPALTSTNIKFLDTGDSDVLSYLRYVNEGQKQDNLLIVVNRSKEPKTISLKADNISSICNGMVFNNLWAEKEGVLIKDDRLTITIQPETAIPFAPTTVSKRNKTNEADERGE